jgi:hypothetical protein
MAMNSLRLICALVGVLLAVYPSCYAADAPPAAPWKVGSPIVTYWCGPPMTDATAAQMAEGGFNLVWCGEEELNVAQRHGLRAQLTDGLLSPATLENPAQREKLDALIARVRLHPALYDYFITDEPTATNFPALGKLVAYLRERDPAHLAYINLFPTYASNDQLGNKGDPVTAYHEHLQQYVDIVKPGLISYDHYQFSVAGDNEGYFLNVGMIRRAAQDAGLPFLNIVQAATWSPSMRVPTGDEVRYLIYTTLAYGAQGISYYVYCCPGHTGAISQTNGTPTPLYYTLKALNREFVAIAQQLQPLRSLGVYHAGMFPQGTEPVPADARFQLDPSVPTMSYTNLQPVKGVLLGYFGAAGKGKKTATPSHVMVVNLDYQAEVVVGIRGPSRLELFDPATGRWSPTSGSRADLHLARGGGQLMRVRR